MYIFYGLPCRYQAPRAASGNPSSSSAELESFSPQRQRPSSAAYLPLGASRHTSQWYVPVLYMWAGLSLMLHKAGIGERCLDLKFTLLFLESMHSTLFSYVLVSQDVIPEAWLLTECVWWSLVFFWLNCNFKRITYFLNARIFARTRVGGWVWFLKCWRGNCNAVLDALFCHLVSSCQVRSLTRKNKHAEINSQPVFPEPCGLAADNNCITADDSRVNIMWESWRLWNDSFIQ